MKNFWENKRVLVTGASGFLGSHMVHSLLVQGAKVTAQVSLRTDESKYANLSSVLKDIRIIKSNLLDSSQALKASQKIDAVINFAALDGGGTFKRSFPAEIFKTNSQIVLNMLEASRLNAVERFLLISSVEIYPETVPQPMLERYGFMKGLDEKVDGYAWSKRFSEITAKMYASQYGMKIGIARLGNIYGPWDHIDKGRVVPTFITQALNNEPISVWNGGIQKKSFLHVKDLATSLLLLAEKYAVCDPVNIASSNYISIKDLAEMIIKLTNSKSRIENIASDLSAKDRIIAINKARKVINFNEEMEISLGLQEAIEDIKKKYKVL